MLTHPSQTQPSAPALHISPCLGVGAWGRGGESGLYGLTAFSEGEVRGERVRFPDEISDSGRLRVQKVGSNVSLRGFLGESMRILGHADSQEHP